jgi:hypothetical protein
MDDTETYLMAVGTLKEKKTYLINRIYENFPALESQQVYSLANLLIKKYSFDIIVEAIPTVFNATPQNVYAKMQYAIKATEGTRAATKTLDEQKQTVRTLQKRKELAAPSAEKKKALESPLDAVFDLYINDKLSQEEFLAIGHDSDKAREVLERIFDGSQEG